MGTKKQWTGKEKLAIVLQGLKGRENRRLKETIGELTIELKKNDW